MIRKIITVLTVLSLMSILVPAGSCLDVSVPAIKARQSDEYSPNTAWELGYTGKGITIAVMDCGVDDEHESLKGKFIAGVDFTLPDTPLTPRDGSYNPDDASYNINVGNYEYTCGHGTHVAGIAMGTGGSDRKYKGVAPDAKLIDVKTVSAYTPEGLLDQDYGDKMIQAVEWCIKHKDTDWNSNGPDEYDGIDIITMSQGVPDLAGQGTLAKAINKAVSNGIVCIQCMGNYGPDNNESSVIANADEVISVGAINDHGTVDRSDDRITNYSNRGPRGDDGDSNNFDELKPDVCASGNDIMSAEWSQIGQASSGYQSMGGTSMATPHVAGVVALMLEANPDLTPKQIKDILHETAEQRGTADYPDYPYPHNKWNCSYGYGIVNAYEAVKAARDFGKQEEETKETGKTSTPLLPFLLILLLIVVAVGCIIWLKKKKIIS